MANIFLNEGETGVNVANNGDQVFGQAGDETVNILAGVTGVVLDQNVEGITLGGNKAAYTFEQSGNQLLIKSGTTIIATVPVQVDADGTQLTFDDGTFNATFNAGVIEVGTDPVDPTDPTDPTDTFDVTAGASSVNEGQVATFTLSNATPDTAYTYTISGVSAADVNGVLESTVTTDSNGTATISVELIEDAATEGNETLTVKVGTVSASTTVVDTSTEPVGKTFTLTTDTDAFNGTEGDDTFTGASGTVASEDVIEDASDTDNDTANLVLAADNLAPTLVKIENINLSSDVLDGTAATFNAANVVGSKITYNAGKTVNGVAEITNNTINSVVAGTDISSLSVTGITQASIDAGKATTLITDDANNATDVTNVTVNGDLNYNVTTGNAAANVKMTATKAATVDFVAASTLNAGTTVSLLGSNDFTLTSSDELSGMTVKDSTTDATVTIKADTTAGGGNIDGDSWIVDLIDVTANLNGDTLQIKSDRAVKVSKTQTDLTVDSVGGSATEIVNIETGVDSTSITAAATGGTLKQANVSITADATLGTLDTGSKLVLTGSKVLTIGQTNSTTIDASAYTGNTTITSDAAASIELGSGTNKLTLGDFAYTIAGGTGADTVIATALDDDNLIVASGGGNDMLKIDGTAGTNGTATFTFNGGAGASDTLWLGNGIDTTTPNKVTLKLTDVEKIEVQNVTSGVIDDATAVTLNGSDLNEQVLTVFTADDFDTNTTVNVTADATKTDLSGITLSKIDKFNINGAAAATAETIIGTKGNDTITGNATTAEAADVITGGTGKDTFVFATLTSGTSAAGTESLVDMVKITDFKISEEDKLKLTSTTKAADVAASATLDISGATTETESGNLYGVIKDGIFTANGLSADTDNLDTLAEWVDAAQVMMTTEANTAADVLAFEFSGNTYVVTNEAVNDALDNVIELTGVTGVVALGTTAAANTIVLA